MFHSFNSTLYGHGQQGKKSFGADLFIYLWNSELTETLNWLDGNQRKYIRASFPSMNIKTASNIPKAIFCFRRIYLQHGLRSYGIPIKKIDQDFLQNEFRSSTVRNVAAAPKNLNNQVLNSVQVKTFRVFIFFCLCFHLFHFSFSTPTKMLGRKVSAQCELLQSRSRISFQLCLVCTNEKQNNSNTENQLVEKGRRKNYLIETLPTFW